MNWPAILAMIQKITLHRFGIRIHDPVFLHPASLIGDLFLIKVISGGTRWEEFDDQKRSSMQAIVFDMSDLFLFDEYNIGLKNVFFIQMDIKRGDNHLAQIILFPVVRNLPVN